MNFAHTQGGVDLTQFNPYSKTKQELASKVIYIIDHSNGSEKHYIPLKSWLKWFESRNEQIELIPIETDKHFYRAFYSDPGIYGIQIWVRDETKPNILVSGRMVYCSDFHENNDEETIIV